MKYARILKRKQRRSARFELVHETTARVGEEHSSQRIGCKRDGSIELPGAVALVSPRAEEFKRGRLLRLGRGVCPLRARHGERSGAYDGQKEWPSLLGEIGFGHGRTIRFRSRPTSSRTILSRACALAIWLSPEGV